MHVEIGHFPERALRSEYIARRFKPHLKGKLLDVGCDRAVLKKLLPEVDYFGIDVGGAPDMILNLEEIDELPFATDQFDCLVCADVLEHLDNLHFVFGELVRVCRGDLILSLPNNWANARRAVERGRGSIGHYGLPVQRPVDRHKWFFNLEEAIQFMEGQPQKFPVRVVECFAMERPRPELLRWGRKLLLGGDSMRYLNRFAHTMWTVLRKTA